MNTLINYFVKQGEKVNTIQSGQIIELVSQTAGIDYYDLTIENKYFSRIPCPIPPWIEEVLAREIVAGLQITPSRRLKLSRKPVFNSGDSVQVVFPGGNRLNPKISLEKTGIKYKPAKVIYI